jgi:DNA-directed RNA polymerase subunit RPC12/RpoP
MTDQTFAGGNEGAVSPSSYPCSGCGARVEYAPGTNALRCPYCGYEQQLAAPDRAVREHTYGELAQLPRKPVASVGAHAFRCTKCGAQTESNALADNCQFCGAALIADPSLGELIAPEAVLPFEIDRNGVRTALRRWTSSRWFAPSSLKRVTEAESVKGTYLPHWTYDARTESRYTGQRGEHYWDTETYTETVNGEQRTSTRQVQRTRWYPASGDVLRDFDDILVAATHHVPSKSLDRLDPWPLAQAMPYQPDYLAGYQALRYDVEPEAGLQVAKSRMAPVIEKDCRQHIGGDEQRVHSIDTRYFDIMFKLMLLPVWIASYVHAGRTYQVLVNGRTGEVIGQRPYSVGKIVAAILAAIAAVVVVILLLRLGHHPTPQPR